MDINESHKCIIELYSRIYALNKKNQNQTNMKLFKNIYATKQGLKMGVDSYESGLDARNDIDPNSNYIFTAVVTPLPNKHRIMWRYIGESNENFTNGNQYQQLNIDCSNAIQLQDDQKNELAIHLSTFLDAFEMVVDGNGEPMGLEHSFKVGDLVNVLGDPNYSENEPFKVRKLEGDSLLWLELPYNDTSAFHHSKLRTAQPEPEQLVVGDWWRCEVHDIQDVENGKYYQIIDDDGCLGLVDDEGCIRVRSNAYLVEAGSKWQPKDGEYAYDAKANEVVTMVGDMGVLGWHIKTKNGTVADVDKENLRPLTAAERAEIENPVVASGWIARDKVGDYYEPYDRRIVTSNQIEEQHLTKTKEEIIAVAKYTYYEKFAPYTPVQVQIRKDGRVEIVGNKNENDE